MKKQAVVNTQRFVRVKGKSRRYLDLWNGKKEVSRRYAIEATTNIKIEERTNIIRRERRSLGEALSKTNWGNLDDFLAGKKKTVRGEKAKEYNDLKRRARGLFKERKKGWSQSIVDDLYEIYDEDTFDDFDWHSFFGSPVLGEG